MSTHLLRKLLNLPKTSIIIRQPKLYKSLSTSSSNSKENKKLWIDSGRPEIEEYRGITAPELFFSRLAKWENAPSFVCGLSGRSLTHGQVYKMTNGFATSLIKSGLKKGDAVAIILPNIIEFPAVICGIMHGGLIASTVNPSYTIDEIKKQLDLSEAKSVVTLPQLVPMLLEIKKTNPNLRSIIVVSNDGVPEGCHSFNEMAKADPNPDLFLKGGKVNTEEEVAILPFSSGTTGPPKGVVLTHANLVSNVLQQNAPGINLPSSFDGVNNQSIILGLLPFFHIYGLNVVLASTLYNGAKNICLPKFDPETFVKILKNHKMTKMHLVTPLINFIVNNPQIKSDDLKTINSIMAGAAPIGKSLIMKLMEKCDKDLFFQEGYGLTELAPVSHKITLKEKNLKFTSTGRPLPSTISKIVDISTGEDLGPMADGEICVKGPQMMKGYFKNKEATHATIKNGWLHTGDIGHYDEDGCFYIIDRLKELIKVKGFQVAPAELEDILRKNSSVADVAVIGIPNEESGELPRAYVVKKDDSIKEIDIQNYVKEKVATFKQLKGGVEFVKEIPKAASGKILRRELKQDYLKKYT